MSITNNIVFDYLSKTASLTTEFCVRAYYYKESQHKHVSYTNLIDWFMNTSAPYIAHAALSDGELNKALVVLFDKEWWNVIQTDRLTIVPYTLCSYSFCSL